MTRVLGPFRTDFEIRDAAVALIYERVGVYADEIMRQLTDDDTVRPIRPLTVVGREALERLPEDQLPMIVVSTPDTAEVEHRDGDGRYAAGFVMQVTAFAQSTDEEVGGKLASVLALAACAAVLHGLPGRAGVTRARWAGQASGDDGRLDRSQHRSAHYLQIVVGDVLSDNVTFPVELLPDPPIGDTAADPGDVPTVETVGVTTTPVEEIDP